MPQPGTQFDWREKVNPVFPLAVQLLQMLSLLLRSGDQAEAKRLSIDACERAISLLPDGPTDMADIDMSEWQEKMANEPETCWLADPKVCDAMARLLGRLKGLPKNVFTKHFAKPHWWMTQDSWAKFLQEQGWAQGFLNILSLLHFNVPLPELTQRISDGDFVLLKKLSRVHHDGSADRNSARILKKLLSPLGDATKIVGWPLLLRGNPPGHSLRLRLVLFFGWDFGLSELSIPELYDFLIQLNLIRPSYDPETLRRYRDRIRDLIDKSRNRQLSLDN